MSDTGKPPAGMPGAGKPGAGTPGAGTLDAEMRDAGMPNADKTDPGAPGAGKPGTGKPDAGKPDVAHSDPGKHAPGQVPEPHAAAPCPASFAPDPPPQTATRALRAAMPALQAAGVSDAPRDARRLLAHAMGLAPDRLTLHLSDPLTPDQSAAFQAALAARRRRQPVSQIIGSRSFWGRSFRVTRDTLDPRPETETLIEAALAAPFRQVLDLGLGSGCILLTLLAERPEACGLGTDISPAALAVAQGNAQDLGLGQRARFAVSDWWGGVMGQFDLIVSNPPYIAMSEMAALAPEVRDWEPRLALTPGDDGLSPYREIARGALAHLAPGGRLIVEIGPTQARAVSGYFTEAGLISPRVLQDLDGRDRVVLAHRG